MNYVLSKRLTRQSCQRTDLPSFHFGHHILKLRVVGQKVELHIQDCIGHLLVPLDQSFHFDPCQTSQRSPTVHKRKLLTNATKDNIIKSDFFYGWQTFFTHEKVMKFQ